MNIINFNEVLVWSSYCCLKQNESLFHTHGIKAESMTIILFRYVFHTLVFTVLVWTSCVPFLLELVYSWCTPFQLISYKSNPWELHSLLGNLWKFNSIMWLQKPSISSTPFLLPLPTSNKLNTTTLTMRGDTIACMTKLPTYFSIWDYCTKTWLLGGLSMFHCKRGTTVLRQRGCSETCSST